MSRWRNTKHSTTGTITYLRYSINSNMKKMEMHKNEHRFQRNDGNRKGLTKKLSFTRERTFEETDRQKSSILMDKFYKTQNEMDVHAQEVKVRILS